MGRINAAECSYMDVEWYVTFYKEENAKQRKYLLHMLYEMEKGMDELA